MSLWRFLKSPYDDKGDIDSLQWLTDEGTTLWVDSGEGEAGVYWGEGVGSEAHFAQVGGVIGAPGVFPGP